MNIQELNSWWVDKHVKKELVPAKISDLLKFKKSHLKKVTQSFKPEYGAEPNITMGVKDNENF